MISMSNSFKEAIKSATREIKGYVEVITNDYIDKSQYTISGGDTSDIESITTYDQANDDKRVVNKYASFEKDYFLLDGSFILPTPGENDNAGYISTSISHEEDGKYFNGDIDVQVTITSELSEVEGLTLYFDEDVFPTKLYYYKNGDKVEITNKSNVLNIFDTITFTDGTFDIYFTELNEPNRRLRIHEIDLGITYVYQNNDLIDFTINEKVDVLKEEMPINECDVTLNNINYQFDPINPQGIAKYFDGAMTKPYIGVVTKDKGVEYCPCGVFYVTEWKNSDDKTTLTCQTIFKKMSEEYSYVFEISNGFDPLVDHLAHTFKMFDLDYEYKGSTENAYIFDWYREKNTELDYLRDILVFANLIGYVNRYGTIVIDNVSTDLKDSISLNECKSFPQYTTKNTISSVTINEVSVKYTDIEDETLYTKNIDITGDYNQILTVDYDSNIVADISSISAVSGAGSGFGIGFSVAIFNSTYAPSGEIDAPITGEVALTVNKTQNVDVIYTPTTYTNNSNGDKLEIKNPLFNRVIQSYIDTGVNYGMELSKAMKNTKDFIFAQNTQYSIDVSYIGDPSLEAGDLIDLETRYGYKNVRIKEHELKFDGGLEGTIKGVGN